MSPSEPFFLPLSLQAWRTPDFENVFRHETQSLSAERLPLQQGLQNSSYVISDKLAITVLSSQSNDTSIMVKAGLLYNGVIAGCSCADDPTPLDETNEYCEVLFCIDKQTAKSTVTIID